MVSRKKSQSERTPEEQKKFLADLIFTKHLSVTWRVFLITAGSVAVLGGLGYVLDSLFGTGRILTAAGVVLSFIVAQVLNFFVFSRLVRSSTSPTQ